jgi:hypothetical protein
MSKLIVGSLLSAVALFLFGFLFWGLSPLPYQFMGKTADDKAAGQALLEHFPQSGTYVIPGQYNDRAAISDLMKSGPLAVVHIRREGGPEMPPMVFVLGFLQFFVISLIVAAVLRKALPSLPSYSAKVGFTSLLGLGVAVFSDLGNPIWWQVPWSFFVITAVYSVLAATLSGLVLAKFVK